MISALDTSRCAARIMPTTSEKSVPISPKAPESSLRSKRMGITERIIHHGSSEARRGQKKQKHSRYVGSTWGAPEKEWRRESLRLDGSSGLPQPQKKNENRQFLHGQPRRQSSASNLRSRELKAREPKGIDHVPAHLSHSARPVVPGLPDISSNHRSDPPVADRCRNRADLAPCTRCFKGGLTVPRLKRAKRLFVPQGHHRINTRRPSRRHETGDHSGCGQDPRGDQHGGCIMR